MRVKIDKKKGTKVYVYTGDEEKEIESCKREIAKKTEELKIWIPVYEKMKHEVEYRQNRIKDCEAFIRLAEEDLKRRKAEENNSDSDDGGDNN